MTVHVPRLLRLTTHILILSLWLWFLITCILDLWWNIWSTSGAEVDWEIRLCPPLCTAWNKMRWSWSCPARGVYILGSQMTPQGSVVLNHFSSDYHTLSCSQTCKLYWKAWQERSTIAIRTPKKCRWWWGREVLSNTDQQQPCLFFRKR